MSFCRPWDISSHIIPRGIISGGSGAGLSMSPYQHELTRLRMERLRIEEVHILEVKQKEELERIHGPQPKWLVSPFFLLAFLLIAARKRSCGKIMFSQVSVILSGGGGWVGRYGGGWISQVPWYTHQYCYLVAATTKRTVGKQVVRILLECFLVQFQFFSCNGSIYIYNKVSDFIYCNCVGVWL